VTMNPHSSPVRAEGLMTARDVAAYLKVSERQLRDLIAHEGLPVISIGKKIRRFRRKDVDAWLQRQVAADSVPAPSDNGSRHEEAEA